MGLQFLIRLSNRIFEASKIMAKKVSALLGENHRISSDVEICQAREIRFMAYSQKLGNETIWTYCLSKRLRDSVD